MSNNAKAKVQQQFGPKAEKYRDSSVHAKGADLSLMVESAKLSGNEKVLDIALGAGHTALAFAPYVERCYGVDLTEEMVQEASELANSRGIENVEFLRGDAEDLPYPDSFFDVVTCRFAAHHFSNIKQFVSETARVLKPGGRFLMIDHYAPENSLLDTFINDVDRMRDPSHVREQTLSEWRYDFEQSGLIYEEMSTWDLRLEFANWVERSATPANVRHELVKFLQTAPSHCKETFDLQFNEHGQPDSFCLKVVLLQGTGVRPLI
ncbi:methyltransferase family protein [Scopulibacillus darangshiensis]|uniref:Methyltransferase family protein n=1 Tax=Scopulibacillus darangshiensis TaxID=442528 RepID=A0A4R2P673_9BACL|nr:class I SAM-dependent methyltransferase [Scopulibacillus darangshiensis]TCP29481.1 methyltransferase family protein [Scopulibacillus darangshiensis]